MTSGQSLADGAVGIALLHLETGRWETARAALEQAVADGASIAAGAGLYYGAPALTFVLASSTRPCLARAQGTATEGTAVVTRHRLDAAHRRIDRHQRPHYSEYDLIGGLTGLGVVLRRISDHNLLREVLRYLVRLTEPLDGLPGWWCTAGPSRNRPGPPGGHSNHGVAHGISGIQALLALTLADGIAADGQAEAIRRICRWLDTWQQQTRDGGIWWPQTVTLHDLHRGTPSQQGPLRPSWCYGTPGIARAQQLAALALGDIARQHLAETAFTACIRDPAQTSQLTGRGLCHGTAGLLAAGRRIAADAITPVPLIRLLPLHQKPPGVGEPEGFLDGAAGAALAAAGILTSWDACLLLS